MTDCKLCQHAYSYPLAHAHVMFIYGEYTIHSRSNWTLCLIDIYIPLQCKSAPPFCFLLRATWNVWTFWSLSPLAHGVTSPVRKVTTWLETTHLPVWPRNNGANLHPHAQVGHRNCVKVPCKQHKLCENTQNCTLLWWESVFLFLQWCSATV